MRPFATLLLLPLTACGGSAAAGALATRADSAGITIVTNTDASWREGDGWHIDPTPQLEIGPTDTDDPRYDFLRISGGSILPSGEVVVLVAASREIRIFSPEGEWIRSIGRDGEGPGEMRGVGTMVRSGDTLFVPDVQLGRLSAFSTSGAFLTSWPFPNFPETGRTTPSHRLTDGSWVASTGIIPGIEGPPPDGLSRPPRRHVRLAADLGAVLDTLAQTTGTEQMVNIVSGPGGGIVMMRMTTPPLGRSAPITAGSDRFVWGDNAAPELRIHAPDGRLHTILRWEAPAIAADAVVLSRMKQAALAQAEGRPQAIENVESQFAIAPPGPHVPFFASVRLDAEGAFWVQEYLQVPTDTLHFRIFDPDGQYLGRRSLPPRHRVLEIGESHLLTVWQDDDDLEYVRVYGLRR